MTSTPDETVSGTDFGSQMVRGLAPLAKMASAINQQTVILSNIHQALMGDTSRQSVQQRSATLGMVRSAQTPGARNPTLTTDAGAGVGGTSATVGQTTVGTMQQTTQAPTPTHGTLWVPPAVAAGYPPAQQGGAGTVGGPPAPGPPVGGTTSAPGGSGPAGPVGPGGPGGDDGGGGGGGRLVDAPGEGLVNRGYNWAVGKIPALSLPNSFRNEYQSQINKNNWYRRMGGADTQMEAFQSRIDEEKARFSYGRLWNEQEARFAFKGTRALGFSPDSARLRNGMDQKSVMDFMYQGKEQYGAAPQEMMQYVQMINQNASMGVGHLDEFNKQMQQLTKNAADAGVSMSTVNKSFQGMFQTNTAAGMGAPGMGLAFAQSEALTGMGPTMQHQAPTLMTQAGAGQRYTLAAQMGITEADLESKMKTTEGQIQVLGMESGSFITRMRDMIQSASPEGWAWLVSEVQARSDELASNPDGTAEDIAQEFWTSHYGALNRDAFLQMANSFGPTNQFMSAEDATKRLITEMGGQGAAKDVAEQAAGVGAFDTKTGKATVAGSQVSAQGSADDLAKLKGGDSGFFGSIGDALGGGDKGKATEAYLSDVDKTGTGSGIIQKMLLKMNEDEENSGKVEVKTSSGNRVVSVEEAVKNYSGQLASGDAKMVGSGQTLADYTGSALDTSEATTSEAASEQGKTDVGQSAEEYYKEHPDEKPGAAGATGGLKGIIDLSPEASRYFVLQGFDESDAAGEPRSNDQTVSGYTSGHYNAPTYSYSGG